MKTACLALILSIATFCAHAQSNAQKIAHFDKNWRKISNDKSAVYYRTVEPSGNIFIVRDYVVFGDVLEMEAECIEYIPNLIRHGSTKRYYKNGNLSESSTYKDNTRVGVVTYYYETGTPREKLEFIDKKTLHRQHYAEDGKELLANGNGTLTGEDEDGATIYTVVKYYEYFKCYKLKTAKDTVFLTAQKLAEYPGGLSQLGADIGRKMTYPKRARKAGIEGTVYVSFVINKVGKIEDVQIIKGFDTECDEEAMRVISELKPWTPAIERGKVVKSRYVLPIKFSLS
jgi:TonB family protein